MRQILFISILILFHAHLTAQNNCKSVIFEKDDKYGLKSANGQIIIPAKYGYINSFTNNLAIFSLNGKKGIINCDGKEIIPAEYDCISNELAKIIVVKKDGRYGLFGLDGKLLQPCEFEMIKPFKGSYEGGCQNYFEHSNYAIVKKETLYGAVDNNGKLILGFQFHEINDLRSNVCFFMVNGKYGIMDKNLQIFTNPKYDEILYFQEDLKLGAVRINNLWCLIDENGKEISGFIYDNIGIYTSNRYNEMILAKKNGKEGLIDNKNNVIVPFEYEQIDEFENGRGKVIKNGKKGLINKNGKILVPALYDDISVYNRVAVIKKDNLSGIFDTITQKELIAPAFLELNPLANGWIKVRGKDSLMGIIDKKLRAVVPLQFNDLQICSEWGTVFRDTLIPARKNDKWGYIDSTGKTKISFEYDNTLCFDVDYALVKKKEKEYCINSKGEIYFPTWFKKYATGEYATQSVFSDDIAFVVGCEYENPQTNKMFGRFEGYINRGKKLLFQLPDSISADTNRFYGFSEGLAVVKYMPEVYSSVIKYGYIDKAGKMIIPFGFFDAGQFSEGLAFAAQDEPEYKVGYINKSGEFVITLPDSIAPKYPGACYFHGGKFKNGKAIMKWGERNSDCASYPKPIIVYSDGKIEEQK